MLREVREEIERDIFRAIKKAISPKLQKMQAKLDKCIEEKTFLDDVSDASATLQFKLFLCIGKCDN